MATNPNDVVKVLNEMMKTLEQLSDAQLESVEGIFKEQQKILENDKKIKKSQKELVSLKKQNEKKDLQIKKEEHKTLKGKKDLLSSLVTTGKTLGKKQFKFSFDKSKKINDIFSKENFKQLLGKLNPVKKPTTIDNQKKSQSLLNFVRNDDKGDIQEEQLHVLKQIDSKIDRLSQSGSGSLFDLLSNGLSSVVSKALGIGLGGAETVGAGAAIGGLGKAGKFVKGLGKASRISRLAKVGGGRALKFAGKNKIAFGLATAAALGLGAYEYFNNDDTGTGENKPIQNGQDTTVEQRAKGGKIKSNSMYIVGENGPELFSPNMNGQIIPNHKLQQKKEEKLSSISFQLSPVLEEFKIGFKKNLKDLVKKITGSFTSFGKSISDKLSDWYSNIKVQLTTYIDKLISSPKKIFDAAKNVVSSIYDKIKSLIVPEKEAQKNVIPSNPQVFKFNVEDVKKPTLEQYNPFPTFNDKNTNPVNIQSNYDVKVTTQSSGIETDVNKQFWIDMFLPEFAKAIIVKKPVNTDRTLISSNPFGI